MNVTLLSLVAAGLHSFSPLFTNVPSMTINNCKFIYHYSSIIYSYKIPFKSYHIDHSLFNSILTTAINMDSIEDKTYTQTLVDKGDLPQFDVRNSLFMKCVSESEGGGIRMGSEISETIFTILYTGFTQCKALNGDAFYSQTRELVLMASCIDLCPNTAVYAKAKSTVRFTQATITNSRLDSPLSSNILEITRSNISKNTNQLNLKSTAYNLIMSNINYLSNTGPMSLLLFDTPTATEIVLNGCNFVDNRYDYLLSYRCPAFRITECSFVDDHCTKYSAELPSSYSFILTNCKFSVTIEELQLKLPSNKILNGPQFNQRITVINDVGLTEQCWARVSSGSGSRKSSFAKYTFIFIVFALIVGGVGFLAYNFLKGKCKIPFTRQDQVPLFYTGL